MGQEGDATKTCAEVLDLAEELHTFMKEQQESQESMTDNHNMSAPSGESGESLVKVWKVLVRTLVNKK